MNDISSVDFSKIKGLNTPTEKLIENVEENIRRRLPQLRTYPAQKREICIVAGGPSLATTWDELVALARPANGDLGAVTLTVNGTYRYLLEHDIEPGMFCMLDAREWNRRFVDLTSEKTKHFIASQCDPAVFDSLSDRDVTIWHSPIPTPKGARDKAWDQGKQLYRDYYFSDRNYVLVPGGVTCTAKTVMLSYWLGFRRIHMFGFDSCWLDGEHHAYAQPENTDKNIRFYVGDQVFNCAGWMAHQADSFFKMVPNLPKDLNLRVYGDGLIAYGLAHAAELTKGDDHAGR